MFFFVFQRLLDAGGCVSECHHPIDVASVLKLYLRCLPEPLISAEVQDLLLRCKLTMGDDTLKSILHTLLLLPVLHVHLLHYITELLNFIASKHKENLMDSSNLAIVMTPSIMPLPAAASAQRLEHHVALVKIFIENSKYIGLLTDDLMTQLDEDSDVYVPRRKRRSGSLNRVLNGLRKMVSGSVNTPATVRENGKTPVMSKSAPKRKIDNYEGLSAKTKKEITNGLPLQELTFTPMKMGLERKRLRLSLMDARSTPIINHKDSESSIRSDDLLTSSEHLFSPHDTIDLSPEMKQTDDYVRISKQEYEEIKSRVSAIENRLSREFTDVVPRVQPLQQVQNVYEQTLEDVAMLNCPKSDHLARRLSKELKIRPNEDTKIIRSPSARKIGSIRRRSRENLTKIVRHKSWNISSQSQSNHSNLDRFYPYIGLGRRQRTSTAKPDLVPPKNAVNDWDASPAENSIKNMPNSSQKYYSRKRISLDSDYSNDKTFSKIPTRKSLNITVNNSWDNTVSESSLTCTLESSSKSNNSEQMQCYQNLNSKTLKSPSSQPKQKWRNAAAFFMNKAGEVDKSCQTGRPSVNKLRRQNAGAVLAKAKLFESSSDKSSERNERVAHSGFARKPRISGLIQTRPQKVVHGRPKLSNSQEVIIPALNSRQGRVAQEVINHAASRVHQYASHCTNGFDPRARKTTPPIRKALSPPQTSNGNPRTPQVPILKKTLYTPKNSKIPAVSADSKRNNIPMRAMHVSPRRRSPRQKTRIHNQPN